MPWAPHPGWHDMLGRDLSWLPWHCRQHASSIAFQSTDVWPPVWKHYPAAPDILHTAEKDRMLVSTRNRNDHTLIDQQSDGNQFEGKSAVNKANIGKKSLLMMWITAI